MILSDVDIKRMVNEGKITLDPFSLDCVQPASYDLHLHNEFRIYKQHEAALIDTKLPVTHLMDKIWVEEDGSFILHPKSFALGLIREFTGVDDAHVGRLEGKSSLARLGLLIHTTAGFLDPGNKLRLTLELFNASSLPIKLYPGMKIAQIAFEELKTPCAVPYGHDKLSSKYFGVDHIQESQMYRNFK